MAQYDTAEYWAEKYDEVYEKYQHAQDHITELEAERDAIRNSTLEEVVTRLLKYNDPADGNGWPCAEREYADIFQAMKEVQGDKG
jgi:hypothetical protein